ncbi:MAG: hypothetical protein HQ526_03110 [Actinobacteria bacterium]|nr:hypothetical protein [Actinomycetota bacterium]
MNTSGAQHSDIFRSTPISARRGVAAGVALTVVASMGIAAPAAEALAAPTKSQPATKTGFVKPFAGPPRFESAAPTQARSASETNQPLGRKRADAIAAKIGFRKNKTFTKRQYRLLTRGKGVGGNVDAAKLIDASVGILTLPRQGRSQTRGDFRRPRSVLASYGLMVNREGKLQSPANSTAPTRQINSLLVPGGYLGTWCRANGATKSLRELYRSAYTVEAIYGNKSQQQSGVAQLVKNRKRGAVTTVGMSMAPSIWIVNFALIYMISPADAARMPAKWAPIPPRVARAIKKSPTGQVRYRKYAAAFK